MQLQSLRDNNKSQQLTDSSFLLDGVSRLLGGIHIFLPKSELVWVDILVGKYQNTMKLHRILPASVNRRVCHQKKKASYVIRAVQRRRVEENNPHPSQLTAHSAARENSQSSTGANPPTAQGARSVNADWLANLGTTIAAAGQKSLQEASIMVNNPQSVSQPDIQFIPDTPQSNNMSSPQQDASLLTQTPAQAAIQQVTSNLIEATTQPTTSKNTFVSVAVPLSSRVSDKVK